MTERDPRIDPRPGDVLNGEPMNGFIRRAHRRVVGRVPMPGADDAVRYVTRTGTRGRVLALTGWKTWAKTAKVVKRAD
jgi:hypothetical protein